MFGDSGSQQDARRSVRSEMGVRYSARSVATCLSRSERAPPLGIRDV